MRMRSIPVFVAALLVFTGALSADTPPLALDFASLGTSANNASSSAGGLGWSLGWSFYTNAAVTVTSLDYWNSPSGLTQSHDVGIYDSSQNLIVSAFVGPDDPVIPDGAGYGWQEVFVRPVTLAAHQTYYIAGVTGTVDPYAYSVGGVTTIPQITYLTEQDFDSATLVFPLHNTWPTSSPAYFGPNFNVPEPLSFEYLFGYGMMGLAALGLARKKPFRS